MAVAEHSNFGDLKSKMFHEHGETLVINSTQIYQIEKMAANTNKKYLTISKEIGELRDGMGFKSKSIAGAKIFAKSAFNIGKFIVTELPPEIEKAKKREEQKRAKKNKL